jgi:hypothetical protein
MKFRLVLLVLAAGACCAGAESFEWESKDNIMCEPAFAAPRIRADDPHKRLDELRDNATADDYRTVRIQGKNGRAAYRRVPTEEFAARIERAEMERDFAEAELRARERSPF